MMWKLGMTLIELIITVAILILIVSVVMFLKVFGLNDPEFYSKQAACASHLQQIHKAMAIYSQSNRGNFPSIPLGEGLIVGEDNADRNLRSNGLDDPFKDFPPNANHSISQNLWLLVREEIAQPEIFLCPLAKWAGEKCDRKADGRGGYRNFVDFPWQNPEATISYSFIQPWSRLTKGHSTAELWRLDGVDTRVVIGGDANNGKKPDHERSHDPATDCSWLKKYVNSTNHKGESENLLFGDGHVERRTTAYSGIENDNVYTALPADYSGKPENSSGTLRVRPRDQFDPKINKPQEWDTVLIPVRDADLDKWNRKP